VTPPVCLTVAGTDSGGAAGIAADLATFAALGVHGACAVSAVTAQDTTGVHDVHVVPLDSLRQQVDAVLTDLPVAAAKTGMLGSPEAVALVAERLGGVRLVVDPVLVATSGAVLGDEQVARAYAETLLPVATVVTPNADEARALTGLDGPPADLAEALTELCPAAVLTGGPDGADTGGSCTDWVAVRGRAPVRVAHPAVETGNDHGTGCTFSAALAARLAHRDGLETAVAGAAAYTRRQLETSRTWTLGRGRGPVAHTHAVPTHLTLSPQES